MAKVLILIRAIQLLIILGIIALFGFNLKRNIDNLNVVTQSLGVITNTSLVPPAITLCLTEEIGYSFSISIYGNVVNQGENKEYLDTYPSDNEILVNLTGVVDKCWILSSPNKDAIILNPPPVNNVPDMNLTYTRNRPNNSNSTAPILINIFDPLELSTNFKYNRFLRLDPDVNRVVFFSRTQYKDIYGNITNDVVYNIVNEFRDPTPSTGNATSSIIIRPTVTTDVINTTWWTVLINSFTLIGVLFSSIYFPLIGAGKFRPWGFLYVLFNYYPVKEITKIEEEGRLSKGEDDTNSSRPGISEVLRLYLDKIEIAQYKR
ncbi:2646_t:CDS:2 [Diversispora eburnea]|uniref:2646_t:CDS:1 n=1 Tax=Diversispora eburnea TaxID=1213867 RepID=A0A9N8ZLI8_9GLOM|nr:2646_t:CDS:2 [Diversispora eburnea]